METGKKCYTCLTMVEANAKVCPRCKAKLGSRTPSGIAAKPGFPLFKLLFVLAALAALGKVAVHSHYNDSAPLDITTGANSVRDGAIEKIKEKGAGDLSSVGVADVGYTDDTLCVYVDQRFNNLSKSQQQQLLSIVASEWIKAIGKGSTAVKVLEYDTKKTLAELVV